MEIVTMTECRSRFKEIFQRIQAGEEIAISNAKTKKIVAWIISPKAYSMKRRKRLIILTKKEMASNLHNTYENNMWDE
jgi:antitoxin (DNA-binding transcriptional repressor) of toxin-antitoxin stability system